MIPLILSASLFSIDDKQELLSRVYYDTEDVRSIKKQIRKVLFERIALPRIFIKLENLFVYARKCCDVVISVISDTVDPLVFRILDNIAFSYMNLGVNATKIKINDQLLWALSKIVDKEVYQEQLTLPTILKWLEDLSDVLEVDSDRCIELALDLGDIEADLPEVGGEWRVVGSKSVGIEELIRQFYAGNLEEVTRKADRVVDNVDLAKILFVSAGILLNLMDRSIVAVPFSKLFAVAKSVEDSFARQYLLLFLQSFFRLGAMRDLEKFFGIYKDKVSEIISKETRRAEVYMLMLLLAPDEEITYSIYNRINEKSSWIKYMLLAKILLMKIFGEGIPLSELQQIDAEVSSFIEQGDKRKKIEWAYAKISRLLIVAYRVLMGSADSCENDVKKFFSLIDDYLMRIEGKDKRVLSPIKAFMYTLTMGFILPWLINKEKAEKYRGYLQSILRWVWHLNRSRRILVDVYLPIIIVLLFSYLKVLSALELAPCDVHNILTKALAGINHLMLYSEKRLYEIFLFGVLGVILQLIRNVNVAFLRNKLSKKIDIGINAAYRNSYFDDIIISIYAPLLIEAKQLLRVSGDEFRRYLEEIKKRFQGLPCVLGTREILNE